MARFALADSLVAFRGGSALYAGDYTQVDLTQPLDVELGLTGQYKTRNFELTGKDFEQMIKNHQDASVDPAVDREHESWFSLDAKPALGWVKSLDIAPASGDKRRSALVGKLHLNDLGQQAVRDQHFRYVSMGFDKAGKNRQSGEPIGAVLDHVALVKNPFIQGMRPLSLALSTKLGHLVEEDPMEALAQQLRSSLGLGADATEEQIMQALATKQARDAAQVAASAETQTALAEQKRINERVTRELEALAKESEARATLAWKSTVKAAVDEFRLDPAELAEYEKLSGAERDVAGRLLALRTPKKPAGTELALQAAARTDEGRISAAEQAIDVELKADPAIDPVTAMNRARAKQPALFVEKGA